MWVKAKIVGYAHREIVEVGAKLCLTEVYLVDADNNRDIHSGHILGDKFPKFKINDVVMFKIIGFLGKGRRVILSLAVQDEAKIQEVSGEGVLDAR